MAWQPDLNNLPDVVWNSDLGAYDQVIALSQYMVNESFRNMWKKVADQPDHPMRSFKIGTKRNGSIDAQLDSPLVVFNVENSNFNEVVYIMRFASGTALMYVNESDEEPTEIPLDGMAYAFRVEIGHTVVSPTTTIHDEITGKLPRTGTPGDYSVARLLIDFTTAKLSNPVESLSIYNLPDWDSKPDLKADFRVLMDKQVQRVKVLEKSDSNAGSTLGYVATTNNPALINVHAPSFVPTSCSFQTYPYFNRQQIGNALPKGRNGIMDWSRFNYICYREMTDKHPPPTDSSLIPLPLRSIWTTDKLDGRGAPIDRGTFMISRRNFWDGYLLPILQKYNGQMECICGSPEVTIELSGFGLDWTWSCGWSIGSKNDRDYSWRTQDGKKNSWYYSSFEGKNADKRARLTHNMIDPYSSEDWTGWISYNYCRSSTKSWCDTEVSFDIGTNRFSMRGVSGLDFRLSLEDWKGLHENDILWYQCEWQIDFILGSVRDGGMEIRVYAQEPKLTEGQSNNFQLAQYGHGSLKPALDYAKKYFQESLKNLTDMEANLTNAFKSQNKFFFPGAGAYFFEDPTFTHNGDMYCRISYNGDQDAPERYAPKVTPQNLPKNPPQTISGSKENKELVAEAKKEKAEIESAKGDIEKNKVEEQQK